MDLKELRQRAGLRVEEVAAKIGVAYSTVEVGFEKLVQNLQNMKIEYQELTEYINKVQTEFSTLISCRSVAVQTIFIPE